MPLRLSSGHGDLALLYTSIMSGSPRERGTGPGTTPRPRFTLAATTLDAPEAEELARRTMTHLDIEVEDLPAAVEHALALGAAPAGFQPQDDVRVLLDPAGHPFCLFTRPAGSGG